jgi:hypothetical protein
MELERTRIQSVHTVRPVSMGGTPPKFYINLHPTSTDRGEIWANTLHNVMHALVQEHGWSHNARTNPDTTEGNVVWMHLFIDSFSLMPCNPTCESSHHSRP